MKIIVTSDTHGSLYKINLLSKLISEADIFIHLGDYNEDVKGLTRFFPGQTYAVKGNCDLWCGALIENLIVIENAVGVIVKVLFNFIARKFIVREVAIDAVVVMFFRFIFDFHWRHISSSYLFNPWSLLLF